MTRWKLILEWDGEPFMGWQRQDHGPSVQAAVERAARAMTGEAVTAHAAGRTDAGVHALGMAAHIDLAKPLTAHRLREGMNALLRPDPVAVLSADEVSDDWHARFSCDGRRYLYRIANRRAPLTLDRGKAWRIGPELDLAAMRDAAAMLVGRHDFTTFRSVHCQSESPLKTLDRLEVEQHGREIHIHAAARSFLHHQVRSMVGCLALVGQGQWRAEQVREALEARDRTALGLNAPAAGLYFVEALYPDKIEPAEA
ncbi:tRNA pseudouridine(38-40) synthase TruA [Sphingomonas sp. GCM10030256]|uniref:tRNA pseudouridine(38-40) synthase TruA n=1 Tax=Sphingomonas sp. GCM10030256 TaxID=3273427 RepID=UPI003606C691